MEIKADEVVAVLAANGFSTPQESWEKAYNDVLSIGAGYIGTSTYPTIDSLLNDFINGGSILVPASVSKETVDVFALAASHIAQYQITVVASPRDFGDGNVVWDVAEE